MKHCKHPTPAPLLVAFVIGLLILLSVAYHAGGRVAVPTANAEESGGGCVCRALIRQAAALERIERKLSK